MTIAFFGYRLGLKFFVISTLLSLLVVTAVAQSPPPSRVWQMTGPFGGDVLSLAIDPQNGDVVLIGTQDGQLFRSTDGGKTWKRVKPGIGVSGYGLTAILFDRARPGTIFVGAQQIQDADHDATGGGVWMSTDGGSNWKEIPDLKGRSVRGIV